MESIDLELGELFDNDAVDVDDTGEDVGAQASGFGEDDAAADGEGYNVRTVSSAGNRHYSHQG